MKLEINGVEYDNFTSASAEIRLDALSNTFSFGAVSTKATPLPFKGGEACRVRVDGETVLTGTIEVVNVDYSDGGHSITLQGRDKTGDILDSSLSPMSDLRAPITLKSIIQKAIANIGADIKVVDEVNPAPFNAAEDLSAPEPGENAFEFMESHARKRQVLLTSNGSGDVVITGASSAKSAGALQNILDAEDNNIIAGSVSYDLTGRYNAYKFASALNPISLLNAGDTGIGEVVAQEGNATDPNIRIGRQLVLVAEGPFSSDQDKLRAKWEANIRKARGRVYSVTVRGYRTGGDTGDLWAINTRVPIRDDFAGIDAEMLINTVTFGFDLQNGRQTVLSLLASNAYSLALEEPKTEKVGYGLTF